MPRKGPVPKRPLVDDPVYGSKLVSQLVNRILLDGKKSIAEAIVYGALETVAEKTDQDPVVVLKRALDNIRLNAFSLRCPGVFDPILRALLDHGDYYMLLADLRDYIRAQEEMQAQYADQTLWTRKALVNIARSGKFSSDRTISEYATEIWHLDPYRG